VVASARSTTKPRSRRPPAKFYIAFQAAAIQAASCRPPNS
jgi:hypothetical protein